MRQLMAKAVIDGDIFNSSHSAWKKWARQPDRPCFQAAGLSNICSADEYPLANWQPKHTIKNDQQL